MKKTLAKVLALALCAVLLVSGTVFVTLAYLHHNTNVVKNTFTSTGIEIRLDETEVNEDGTAKTGAVRVPTGQKYMLRPGYNYIKDPIVHVKKGSDKCYVVIAIRDTVFNYGTNTLEVEYTYQDGAKSGKLYKQLSDFGWKELTGVQIDPALYEDETCLLYSWRTLPEGAEDGDTPTWKDSCCKLYYYAVGDCKVDASQAQKDLPIFAGFSIDEELSYLLGVGKEYSLEIVAFAMQSEYGTTASGTAEELVRSAFNLNFGKPTQGGDGA